MNPRWITQNIRWMLHVRSQLLVGLSPNNSGGGTCLSSLDEVIAAQRDRQSALQTHKHGLMQQLFPSPAVTEG